MSRQPFSYMLIHQRKFCLGGLAVLWCLMACAAPIKAQATGPGGGTLLLIRHAEKPEAGDGLTPAGSARANAYVKYFMDFKLHGEPLKLDAVFASADSRNSRRPRLTVEPLAHALGLPVNTTYKDKDFLSLATAMQTSERGKHVLVCWHHGTMAEMLGALGADPAKLLPGGQWPADAYDWVIALRYDQAGRLQTAERIEEGLGGK